MLNLLSGENTEIINVCCPTIKSDIDDIAWANPRLQPLTAKMLQAVVVMKEGLVPRKVAVHS